MRLPTRNGRVVSAVSEVRRLAPRKTPQAEELRLDALKLYRTIMRTIYRAPPSQVRTETYQHARREFERTRTASDPFAIANHLRTGWNEYKMFGYYFEEQRHFAKPLLKREFPHRRVEMLKQLLKVSTNQSRFRVRHLLVGAQKRVDMLEDLQRVLGDAETAVRSGTRLEHEWAGLLHSIKQRVETEAATGDAS